MMTRYQLGLIGISALSLYGALRIHNHTNPQDFSKAAAALTKTAIAIGDQTNIEDIINRSKFTIPPSTTVYTLGN